MDKNKNSKIFNRKGIEIEWVRALTRSDTSRGDTKRREQDPGT